MNRDKLKRLEAYQKQQAKAEQIYRDVSEGKYKHDHTTFKEVNT